MIGRLAGTLAAAWGDRILIETASGVGYEVHVPARTLAALPPLGQPVRLVIHTHVREDAIVLFGFSAEIDRECFRLVQAVTGIGPKIALALVGTCEPAAIAAAIDRKDEVALARIPGIGRKTAARLVLELTDKVTALRLNAAVAEPVGRPTPPDAQEDTRAALLALGYAPKEVETALKRAAPVAEDTVQTLLKRALRALAPA